MNCLIFLVVFAAISSGAASNSFGSGGDRGRYKIWNGLVDWNEARSGCYYWNGITYANIEKTEDVHDLQEEIPIDPTKKYWISGYYEGKPECDEQPFLDICWRWTAFNIEPYYNSSLIQFSDAAKAILPSESSAMLLSFVDASLGLQLGHDNKSALYPTICDYEFREPVQPIRTRKTTTTPRPVK